MHASTWHIDSTCILSRRELAAVLADAKAKATKSANAWRNLIVFRLACCCGLRVSEIAQLEMGDVIADVDRPHLRLRRGATKGGKSRTRAALVGRGDAGRPSGMDGGTSRTRCRGSRPVRLLGPGEPTWAAAPPPRPSARFHTACKILGPARLRTLTIHHGRHTFISHALAGGRTLAEVRAAAGHANVAMTSVYLHVVVDEGEGVGDLFGSR